MDIGWGIFWLLKQQKKGGGRIWVLGVGGVLVFRISVTVGFTGCVHVSLQPFPFPHVSLMYINPDSRGQCVLGEVKLLSSQSIAFNLHSSACGPHSGSEMCLAFPKTGCLLGDNQRDTRRPERP